MLIGKHLADFWLWYLNPKPENLNDEMARKLAFIRQTPNEKNQTLFKWLNLQGFSFKKHETWTMTVSRLDSEYTTATHRLENTMYDEVFGIVYNLLEGQTIEQKIIKPLMEELKIELYTVDSKGKTRISINKLVEVDGGFEIQRTTGLLDGKLTPQPVKLITAGKVKRTVQEQAELEFNAIIKKQKDKGYKSKGDLGFTEGDETVDLSDALGTKRTTVDGFNKPMGAKDLTTVNKKDPIYKKKWWASLKIDGIRTLNHLQGEELIFKTRGGLTFNGVTHNFKDDQKIKDICKKYNCEIDGEFYTHGVLLETLSGVCRLDNYVPERHDNIKLYIFDIADDFRTFDERKLVLDEIREELKEDNKYVVVEHILITGKDAFDKFQQNAIADGYEGLIIRDGSKLYQYGKKNAAMYKEKLFQDEEFLVTGWTPGLRPVEDMVFNLVTSDGKTFAAKPIGDKAQKQAYVDNMDNLIGQYGTVKFFYYTEEGKPFLPSFKNFRPVDKDKKPLM